MIRIKEKEKQPFEQKHIDIVRDIAAECTLFLKKDNTLPLSAPGRVALYGSGARRTIKGGTGSGDVNVRHFVTVEEGMENAGFTVISKQWMDQYDALLEEAHAAFVEQVRAEAKEMGVNPVIYAMGRAMPEPEYEFPLDMSGDLAVYVLSRNSGEGSDRRPVPGDMELSESEIRDICLLNQYYDKFVLVLNVGGMVNLKPVEDAKNILLLSQLGTPTGDVLADILLGKSYPSGKLAMTWAPIEEYASTEGFGDMDDTPYREGIYVGYRYFDSVNKQPEYPFGYGLSYTDFSIETREFQADENEVIISVTVKNIGDHAGKEVVQVYYSAPQGKLDQPYQGLAAFEKTKELQPGEEQEVRISFHTTDMASYDTAAAAYKLEKGEYIFRVGNSSRNTGISGVMVLDADAEVCRLKNICPGCDFEDIKPEGDSYTYETEEKEREKAPRCYITAKNIETKNIEYQKELVEIQRADICTWREVADGLKSIDDFVGSLSEEELAYLSIGLFDDSGKMGPIVGASAVSVAGAAGETTMKLSHLLVPSIVMADGPAGLRLCTQYKVVDGEVKGLDNSLANTMEFLEPEEIRQIMESAPMPSREEQEAPVNYTYCIALPIGTALAQTWNKEAGRRCGDMIGKEMEMFGIHLWLAPAINIQRSPLCGRNFEYYSEDPMVSGRMAAAVTAGVQAYKGCGTTVKHFACNNQETNRMVSNSIVSERALREIYLKTFEICVKESMPCAMMSSYNLINGEHACNSKDVLTYVLRDEWGYQGIVMTDWYAASSIMTETSEREDKYPAGSPAGCVKAGNDLIMPGMPADKESVLEALKSKEVPYPLTKAELQTTARRVLKTILQLR